MEFEPMEFEIENGVLTKYLGRSRKVRIPDGVTAIGSRAFHLCIWLKSVVIPNGVTKIDTDAFLLCKSLKKVKIPSTVKTIGVAAFADCKSLKKIVLPEGVERIENSAFAVSDKLKKITIPQSVTFIDKVAFTGCHKLKYNIFENGLYLGNDKNPYHALIRVSDRKTAKTLQIHSETIVIAESAFFGADSLELIKCSEAVFAQVNRCLTDAEKKGSAAKITLIAKDAE